MAILIDQERCKGCGLCAKFCPKQVIGHNGTFNKAGYDYVEAKNDDCISCGICAQVCPDRAITVTKGDKVIYERPKSMTDTATSYCPGCSHGVVNRIIGELIDEMGLAEESIGVTPIGCSIFIYKNFKIDYIEGAHGRAPAVATGVKRVHPDKFVFTYQGDGDIGAIGLSEAMYAAIRDENFTIIFVNNGNYGMTGGQAAPTTLIGQVTTTTPKGKTLAEGYPVHICETFATVGSDNAYIARGAVDTPQNIRKTKQYIKKAFQHQLDKKGFSMVEVLGSCPSNWKMTPSKSIERVTEVMIPEFPLGEIKNKEA